MKQLNQVLQYKGPTGFKFDSVIANIALSIAVVAILGLLAFVIITKTIEYKAKLKEYNQKLKNYNIRKQNLENAFSKATPGEKPVKPNLFLNVLWIPASVVGLYVVASMFITFTGLKPFWAPTVESQEKNMQSILISKKPNIMFLNAGLSARYDIKLPTTDLDTYDNKWLALHDNTKPKKYHWIGKVEVNNDFKVKTLQTSRIGRKYIKVLNKANEIAKLNGTELIDTQMTTYIKNFNNKPYSLDTKLEVRPGQTYHIIGLMHKKQKMAPGPKTIYVY